jgi:hypothetical protein
MGQPTPRTRRLLLRLCLFAFCGNGAGVLGDASASCGSDTSTGGIIAPPPAAAGHHPAGAERHRHLRHPRERRQHRHLRHPRPDPGTSGLTAGASGGAGDAVTSLAPLRSSASDGSGALPFTGAASELLAVLGAGLLAAGFLVVRATRPDTATKGGGDR